MTIEKPTVPIWPWLFWVVVGCGDAPSRIQDVRAPSQSVIQKKEASTDPPVPVSAPSARVWNARPVTFDFQSSVESVAIHPGGRLLVAACRDKTVKVWDRHDATLSQTFTVNAKPTSVAFHPEGEILVCGTFAGGGVSVWDTGSGKRLGNLPEIEGNVRAVRFSPDGKWIAAVGTTLVNDWTQGRIYLWDAESQQLVRKYASFKSGPDQKDTPFPKLAALAFQSDSKSFYVVGSNRFGSQVWRLKPGNAGNAKEVTELSDANACAFSSNADRFVLGCGDPKEQTILFWDLAKDKLLAEFDFSGHSINQVVVSDNCQELATAHLDGSIRVWDREKGAIQQSLNFHSGSIHCLAYSQDEGILVSGGDDGILAVWSHRPAGTDEPTVALDPNASLWVLRTQNRYIDALDVGSDGTTLAFASDQRLKVHDLRTGQSIGNVELGSAPVAYLQALPGKLLLTADKKGNIQVWDQKTGEKQWEKATFASGNVSYCHGISRDGTLLAIGYGADQDFGSQDCFVGIWDTAKGMEQHRFSVPRRPYTLAFDPQGEQLAIGQYAAIRIWDLNESRLKKVLTGHYEIVESVHFFSYGERLISASRDHSIRVWDVETGTEKFMLARWPLRPSTLAITKDERLVFAGNEKGVVGVWDLETGKMIGTHQTHKNGIGSLALLPDPVGMVTSAGDRTVKVWRDSNLFTVGESEVVTANQLRVEHAWPMLFEDPVTSIALTPLALESRVSVAARKAGLLLTDALCDNVLRLRWELSRSGQFLVTGPVDENVVIGFQVTLTVELLQRGKILWTKQVSGKSDQKLSVKAPEFASRVSLESALRASALRNVEQKLDAELYSDLLGAMKGL